MCVAVPGKIVKIDGDYAKVNVLENLTDVNIKLVEAGVGEYLLIHAGCGIGVLKEDAAKEIIDLFQELQEVFDDEA